MIGAGTALPCLIISAAILARLTLDAPTNILYADISSGVNLTPGWVLSASITSSSSNFCLSANSCAFLCKSVPGSFAFNACNNLVVVTCFLFESSFA